MINLIHGDCVEVMKDFGKAGEHQAMAIKVNYGY